MYKQFIAMKGFIVCNGKVLVAQESSAYKDGSHHNAGYDLVGGRIDPGERHKEALLREIKEEVGKTDITIQRPFATGERRVEKPDITRQIVATFFHCVADTDEVKLGEDHADYKRIDPKNYKTAGVFPNLHEVFEAYLALEQ